MEENIYQIRLTVERMHRLMEELVAQRKCPQCAAQVSLPPEPEEHPVLPTEDEPAEETFNRIGAAHFLVRSEQQVYRYRLSGQLPYSTDEKDRIYYRRSDLERLFKELWGFPKPKPKPKSP